MKKIFFLIMVIFFMPKQFTHSQMLVFDSVVSMALEVTRLEQAIHYANLIMNGANQITQLQHMVDNTVYQIERTLQNLSSVGDIGSWEDFMNWYNRQLYMERRAIETFNNMNVKIGNTNYKLTDIEGIADGISYTYMEYWDREFTEAERREMWLGLGLSPSNYAYVQPFRERARDVYREAFVSSEIQNEWYVYNMERNNERLLRFAADNELANDDPDKLTEKQVLMYGVESSMENNKVLNDIAMGITDIKEMLATEYYLNQVPSNAPILSNWPEDGFRPLVSD